LDIRTKIKEAVKALLAKQTVKLASYPTSDGQTLEVDEQSGTATIDGQPAADGEYQVTVDGTDLVLIVKDGVVTDAKPVEAPTDQQLDDAPQGPTLEELQAQVDQLTQELEAARQQIADLQAQLDASNQNLSAANTKLAKLSEEPAGNPIKLSGNQAPETPAQKRLAERKAKA